MSGNGRWKMAKITFIGGDDFGVRLERLGNMNARASVERAVAKAAGIVADAVRAALKAIPGRKDIFLWGGQMLYGVLEREKEDLLDGLGISPIQSDRNGFVHAKVGFDGYGSRQTKKYPKGTPNQLVAAAIERGSSIRYKVPFIRPAVNKTRNKAIKAMDDSINEDIAAIFDE